jgi:isoleucyl-tRNA synthetase
MIVKADAELPEFCTDIITEEINVKAVEFTSDMGNLVSYNVKPKFDSLRTKFPNEMGMLIGIINKADAGEIVSAIDADGHFKVTLPSGVSVLLEKEDLIIETKKTEGFEAASDCGITVALDTTLTPELIEEGSVREVISNIQKMRKNAGFEVMDHITVYVNGNDDIIAVVKKNEAEIADVCLADAFCYGEDTDNSAEVKINGTKTLIGVKKN